jgi:hypothetical protein
MVGAAVGSATAAAEMTSQMTQAAKDRTTQMTQDAVAAAKAVGSLVPTDTAQMQALGTATVTATVDGTKVWSFVAACTGRTASGSIHLPPLILVLQYFAAILDTTSRRDCSHNISY